MCPTRTQPHLNAQSLLSLTACSYLSLCALTGKVIKEAYANVKSRKATGPEKTIVKKVNINIANGRAFAQPNPNPTRVPNPSSHSPHLCVPTHT